MIVGSFALEGFPFSTGFYSKDAILEITNVQHTMDGQFASLLGHLSVLTTVFYSTRSFFYTFIEDPLSFKKSLLKVEGPKVQRISFFLIMKNSYPNLNNSL